MGLKNLTPRVENQSTTSTMGTALNKTPQEVEQEKIQRQQQLGEQARAGGVKGSAMIGGGASATPQQKMQAQPQKAGTGSFTNLKSYLDAAQGKGQQRVAEAATGQVQRLGQSAQKGKEQARSQFGQNLQTGSGAVFQGVEGQTLAEQEADAARRAKDQTQGVISTATGTTYQAPAEGATTQYFTPEEEAQFANVINAQYQGPESLQQVGAYGQASRAASAAQRAAQQTQTAGGRAQLLRDVFGRDREYGRGASRLDSMLLNASEQGVQQLQEQAQPALQARELLQAAQNVSANEAAQRAGAIEGIRTGAMTDFINARQAQEDEANAYISNIQENWNALPDYLKQSFQQSMANGTYNLTPEEAAILGVSRGQSLFGITPESIRANPMASGAELITKDQLSRQLALARLAGLDKSQALQKNLLYTDLEKAGTKNILDSLNTLSFQRDLAEKEKQALDRVRGINANLVSGITELPSFRDVYRYKYDTTGYNLGDLLTNQGGYQNINAEAQTASASEMLRNLYENPELSIRNLYRGEVADVLGKIRSSFSPKASILSGFNESYQTGVVNPLTQAGFTRDVELTSDTAARQRAEGLRQLLQRLSGAEITPSEVTGSTPAIDIPIRRLG